ncbi:MAG: flagellar motor switch protein FliN [Chitinivibrionia bacterium]|nr:flagellar motor switch protein FliN [Chitinivibrionia bacterium]
MSDFLSQDDIDALLGLTSEDTAPSINKGEIATNILNMYIEHVKSVANATLGRTVNVEIEYVDNARVSAITEKVSAKYLLADVPFSGGCSGNMRCIVSQEGCGIMSDFMVGGDGTAPYTDDCKDAMSEFFGQISGAFATELGAKLGSSVSSDTAAIMDSVGGEVLEGDFTAFCNITIEGTQAPIALLVSPDDTLVEALAPKEEAKPASSGGGSSSSSAAAPAASSLSGGVSTGGSAPINMFSSKAPKINVDMLLDVELEVTIELGKTNIAIKKVLDLAPGALVELERFAGEPVDLLVNNKVVAKGEVVVIDENFGVRIISLVSPEERIRSLK